MIHPRLIAAAWLTVGLTACSGMGATPTATASPAPSPTITLTPTATTIPSATPLACLTAPGSVTQESLDGRPPQLLLVYLPPCYAEQPDERYPVLYLLHGQTYQDDQWVNIGATEMADALIHSGRAQPFIMVFPDDRYWNLPPGDGFGNRLLYEVIPFIDRTYRTRTERGNRALGGLSRGGGWAVRLALTRYDLFGYVGLHSPVVFNDDGAILERIVPAVPADAWPRLWIDAGDRDGDLNTIRKLEALLTMHEVPHEWHIYSGDHTENYWRRHVADYLQWYTEGFAHADEIPPAAPTATVTASATATPPTTPTKLPASATSTATSTTAAALTPAATTMP